MTDNNIILCNWSGPNGAIICSRSCCHVHVHTITPRPSGIMAQCKHYLITKSADRGNIAVMILGDERWAVQIRLKDLSRFTCMIQRCRGFTQSRACMYACLGTIVRKISSEPALGRDMVHQSVSGTMVWNHKEMFAVLGPALRDCRWFYAMNLLGL